MQFRDNQSYEARFFRHITDQFHPIFTTPNNDAFALFLAMQSAYTGLKSTEADEHVPIDPSFVAHLAACGWVALLYNVSERIPWDKSDRDYILERAYEHFIRSLVLLWRRGLVQCIAPGKFVCGNMMLPAWFEEWASTWSW